MIYANSRADVEGAFNVMARWLAEVKGRKYAGHIEFEDELANIVKVIRLDLLHRWRRERETG